MLPNDNEVLLEVKDLVKVFGSGKSAVKAVDGVSFSIERGEIISLLGESGSGKTTTARIILKLLPPTEGRIIFKGKDITYLNDRKSLLGYWREVQAIFQDPFSSFNSFYSVKRVLNNVFRLIRTDITKDEKEEKIRAALINVGLNPDDVLNKRPHELSGGQRQRIMLARILVIRPSLLIADEPTSMIDASSRAGILNLLLDLRRSYGMSIMFITHDIGLAYYTSDKLLIMNNGRIVESGDAETIINSPKDPYTIKLLSDVPVLTRKWEL
ncbi:MAG: ABC transporter ATP-binding protein [bacterium]